MAGNLPVLPLQDHLQINEGIMVDDRCARTGVSSKSIVMLDCWRGPPTSRKGKLMPLPTIFTGLHRTSTFFTSPNCTQLLVDVSTKVRHVHRLKKMRKMRQGFFEWGKHIYHSLFTNPWLKHFKMADFQGPTLNLHPFTISVYHLQ